MSDEMKAIAEAVKEDKKKQPKKPKKKIFQEVWTQMVVDGCRLWASQAGDAYLQLKINDGYKNIAIKSEAGKDALYRFSHKYAENPFSNWDIQDFTRFIVSRKEEGLEEKTINCRMAFEDGKYHYLLEPKNNKMVTLDDNGWKIRIDKFPAFRCPSHIHRQVEPISIKDSGCTVDSFRTIFNVDDDWYYLLLAYLGYSLCKRPEYPVLYITGMQGSGKTTMTRFIADIIDPSQANDTATPTNETEAMTRLHNSAVIVCDNEDKISNSTSNLLCRIATGASIAKRTLYTDGELVVHSGARPIIINSIGECIDRYDLIDRVIIMYFNVINKEQRRSNSDIDTLLKEAKPKLLGFLFDHIVGAHKIMPTLPESGYERMAEFHKFGMAFFMAAGLSPNYFTEIYRENRNLAIQGVAEEGEDNGELIEHIVAILAADKVFEGSMTDLVERMLKYLGFINPDNFIKPVQLGKKFDKIAPVLIRKGISIHRSRKSKERLIKLTWTPIDENVSNK